MQTKLNMLFCWRRRESSEHMSHTVSHVAHNSAMFCIHIICDLHSYFLFAFWEKLTNTFSCATLGSPRTKMKHQRLSIRDVFWGFLSIPRDALVMLWVQRNAWPYCFCAKPLLGCCGVCNPRPILLIASVTHLPAWPPLFLKKLRATVNFSLICISDASASLTVSVHLRAQKKWTARVEVFAIGDVMQNAKYNFPFSFGISTIYDGPCMSHCINVVDD